MTPRPARGRGRTATFFLALSLAACGSGTGGDGAGFVVRDSAGVRIAENAGAAWSDDVAWRVASEPELEIGMMDGPAEYALGNVQAVRGLAGGGVLVADVQALSLRTYDADGRHLRAVGREGGGPGEFRRLDAVVRVRGDTFAVADLANARTTFLLPSGEIVREEPIRRDDSFGLPLFFTGDGAQWIRLIQTRNDVPRGLVRDTLHLGRRRAGTDAAEPVVRLPTTESVYSDVSGGGFSVQARAFGPCFCFAASPDGFLHGTGEAPELTAYSEDAAPTLRVRWPGSRRPVTPSDVSAYRERELAQARERDWMEGLLRVMEYPQQMPVYDQVLTDTDGNAWVRGYHPDPRAARAWWVFAPEGRLLGTVGTPAGLRVHEIGAHHLLGVWTDDAGVQYVRRYALHRPGT